MVDYARLSESLGKFVGYMSDVKEGLDKFQDVLFTVQEQLETLNRQADQDTGPETKAPVVGLDLADALKEYYAAYWAWSGAGRPNEHLISAYAKVRVDSMSDMAKYSEFSHDTSSLAVEWIKKYAQELKAAVEDRTTPN